MGMPVGSDLEYVDEVTMDKAFANRTRSRLISACFLISWYKSLYLMLDLEASGGRSCEGLTGGGCGKHTSQL